MRLIDADALMKAFRDYMAKHHDRERCISQENCNACKVGCLWHRIVKEAPTIDPESLIQYHVDELSRTFHYRVVKDEPEKQGEWRKAEYKPEVYIKRSLCGHRAGFVEQSNYCPNCGAYMKGAGENA